MFLGWRDESVENMRGFLGDNRDLWDLRVGWSKIVYLRTGHWSGQVLLLIDICDKPNYDQSEPTF